MLLALPDKQATGVLLLVSNFDFSPSDAAEIRGDTPVPTPPTLSNKRKVPPPLDLPLETEAIGALLQCAFNDNCDSDVADHPRPLKKPSLGPTPAYYISGSSDLYSLAIYPGLLAARPAPTKSKGRFQQSMMSNFLGGVVNIEGANIVLIALTYLVS